MHKRESFAAYMREVNAILHRYELDYLEISYDFLADYYHGVTPSMCAVYAARTFTKQQLTQWCKRNCI